MPVYKTHVGNKFVYCNDCNKVVELVYEKTKNPIVFKGFAWYCKKCGVLTMDKDVIFRRD